MGAALGDEGLSGGQDLRHTGLVVGTQQRGTVGGDEGLLFTVDPDTYKSDHNYLTFHWDYGDGTKTDTLMPIVPKPYPAGSWDTTFVARMTVSNVCDTVSYDTTITVFSAPKVSFALMHEWECSPVFFVYLLDA